MTTGPLLTSAAKDGRDAQLLPLFAGTRSTKAALAYAPEEFFARFMKGSTSNAPAFTATKSEVLGVVVEGPDRAHAVVRVTHGARPGSAVEVVSLRKAGGVWRVDVPPALAAGAAGFRSADVGVGTATATDKIQPESPNP